MKARTSPLLSGEASIFRHSVPAADQIQLMDCMQMLLLASIATRALQLKKMGRAPVPKVHGPLHAPPFTLNGELQLHMSTCFLQGAYEKVSGAAAAGTNQEALVRSCQIATQSSRLYYTDS
jgi:hypothetical protein